MEVLASPGGGIEYFHSHFFSRTQEHDPTLIARESGKWSLPMCQERKQRWEHQASLCHDAWNEKYLINEKNQGSTQNEVSVL